jgi:putative two-component system response regulator
MSLETRDMAIFMMAKLAESRDPETGQHLERVQRYSRALAEELARTPKYANVIDGDYLRLIFQTSPLHDIGKVGTPDHILLKPGRLTREEFEIMKQHTSLGAQTLDLALEKYPQASFLIMARDIAIAHHEKYDGSGYPNGLSGEDIPLAARIVALADVFDALTSVRVYKDAFSIEKTKEVIIEGRGQHFDPDVVDAFLKIEHRFLEIKKTFAEDVEELLAGS